MKRISTRLAVSFMIVALLPTLPLSLVVRDLLERRFGPAISEPVEKALDAGLEESRSRLRQQQEQLAARVKGEASEAATVLLDAEGRVQPVGHLETFLSTRSLLSELVSTGGGVPRDEPRRIEDALVILSEEADGRSTLWIQPLPEGMVDRAGDMTAAVGLVRTLRQEQDRVILSFVGPFLLVYGVLILVALAAGYFWSRQITGPLEMLVGSTRKVAAGELEFRLPEKGTGEVGELVRSFDNMVGRLSDQRRDLARLERAAAWRGMARTLAHEVKNPLTPILLAVNQARDKYEGDDEEYRKLLTEVAEIVGEEVESLRALVKEFGDFARLPKPKLRPGDLQDLLEDLQQLYGSDRLTIPTPSRDHQGWFDPEALRRALVNLIDNGLAACRQAGSPEMVNITALPAQTGVSLTIADQGTGISAENLAHIFEPDFTTKSDGMGLGLAITESIVIGHGGRISVSSEPGQGTTFTMVLPLTQPAQTEQEES